MLSTDQPDSSPAPATDGPAATDGGSHYSGWAFEIALGAGILLDSLLPLARFHLRMNAGDILLLAAVVLSGAALLRAGHALLSIWLRRQGGPILQHGLGLVGVAVVAAVGMWHGPPHYALTTALIAGGIFAAFVSWFAGPGRAPWRRASGALLSIALYLFMVVAIDINVLSLYPRHVPVLGSIVAAAWLFATLAVAPPLPARAARSMLSLGAAVAGLGLGLVPAASARVAGYLRRQSEVGTLLSPVSWAHAVAPATYLTRGGGICPTVPTQPVVVSGQANRNNLLLITIDTLRRDLYLGPGETMAGRYPNLASVAADGCRYDRIRSVGASTHTAMPALYNGTLAWTTLQRPMLAALADQAGMHARVFGNLWQISGYTGLSPGEGDPAEPVTDRVIDEIDRASAQQMPWMMVAHYLDLHLPRKAELLSQLSGDLRPVYAGKLAVLDRQLGRLFAAVKARGEWERTAIVITADHGEELNERGYSEHAFHLYDTVLGVPLLARLPGQACLPADTSATLVDVLPMLAGALGMTVQSPALEGQWPPQPGRSMYAFSTVGGPFISIIDGNQKVIVDARYGDTEIYDLGADPHERHDIGGELTPALAARLAKTPLPWNPLVPLAQRFRRLHGNQFDICPRATPHPAGLSSSVLGPHASAPTSARLD